MTKAERIYQDTKTMCRRHIQNWGYNLETDGGFNGMSHDTCVYTRTMNEMIKLLESDKKAIAIDEKLNISTPEKLKERKLTLIMLEKTMKNEYIS